jgi:hypothetical protein
MSESRVRSMTAIELVASAEEATRRLVTVPDRLPEWVTQGSDAPAAQVPMRYIEATKRVATALFDDGLARTLYDDFWTLAAEVGAELGRFAGEDLRGSLNMIECGDCGGEHAFVGLVVQSNVGIPRQAEPGMRTAVTCSVMLACEFPDARNPMFGGQRGSTENLTGLCALAWIRALAITDSLRVRVVSAEEVARTMMDGDDEE